MMLFVLITLLLLYIVRGKGNRVTAGLQKRGTQVFSPLFIKVLSCYLLLSARVTVFCLLPRVVTRGNST